MRSQSLAICALLSGVILSVAVQAQPGSGTRWEISMEMAGMPPGMGFAIPKQTSCLSKNVDEAPPADKDCTLLEQHSTGNHHFIKAQCQQGLMEIEQTRTADSMISLMKMTDNSGEVTEMTMKGVAIGDSITPLKLRSRSGKSRGCNARPTRLKSARRKRWRACVRTRWRRCKGPCSPRTGFVRHSRPSTASGSIPWRATSC